MLLHTVAFAADVDTTYPEDGDDYTDDYLYANMTNEEILSERLDLDRSKRFSSADYLGSVHSVEYVTLNDGRQAFMTFESSGLQGDKFINQRQKTESR